VCALLRLTLLAASIALRLFAPEIDIAALGPRRVPTAHHAFRGETTRTILEALRTAAAPLSTTEITRRVMDGRGLDMSDAALSRVIAKRVGACLRHWEKERKAIRSMPGPGQVKLWELVR
jgi:hypothetical protein